MEVGMARGGGGGGGGGSGNRWKSLKRKLGFKAGIGCCGGSWGFHGSHSARWMDEEEAEREEYSIGGGRAAAVEADPETAAERGGDAGCDGEIGAAAMNLATALAAERQFRAASAQQQQQQRGEQAEEESNPLRVSLMRLLAEGGRAGEEEAAVEAWWCCVCMGRRKGAAFIPCGHTLCRVCSREVWINRGACPLCNRPILDVLDIF